MERGTNAHLEKMPQVSLGSVYVPHQKATPSHFIDKLDWNTFSKDVFTGPVGKILSSSVPEVEMNYDFEPLPGGEYLIVLPPNIMKGPLIGLLLFIFKLILDHLLADVHLTYLINTFGDLLFWSLSSSVDTSNYCGELLFR